MRIGATLCCAIAAHVGAGGACAPLSTSACAGDAECGEGAVCVDAVCRLPDAAPPTGAPRSADEEPRRDDGSGEGEGEGDGADEKPPTARFPNGYAVRLPLTIVGARVAGDAPLEDFPLLLDVTHEALRPLTSGGALVLADSAPAAPDVRVEDADGLALALEVAALDPAAGRLLAWVRVPRLEPGVDQALSLYLGGEDAAPDTAIDVWADGYAAVLHFDNLAASGPDAAAASEVIPRNLAAYDLTTGRVGRGLRFSDDDDAVEVWCGGALDDARQITLEAWARMDGEHAQNGFQRLFHMGYAGERVFELFVEDSSTFAFGAASFRVDYDRTELWPYAWLTDFALGSWHHFAAVFDADAQTQRLYVDGVLRIETWSLDEPLDDHGVIHIGNWDSRYTQDESRAWIGVIDEARIATRARSAGWIATGYANTSSPATFVSVGALERP